MKGSTNECPCKYCTPENGRSGECHACCERYDRWVYEKDEKLKAIRQEKDKQLGIFKHHIPSVTFNNVAKTYVSKYRQV